ncbi:MAG: sensor histidine kinase, partial [Spirochaetaceae bacterium]|nr:sensor histidine kinase [Spirochaetaceae bacterium]
LYRLTAIDIGKLTAEIADVHAAHAGEKEITLETDCQTDLNFASNRDLLNILLGNLIDNAIKYSPNRTTIRIGVCRDGADVLFQVKDEGYGIESAQLDQIFEEFYRTRRARELEPDGTGLGLPIVKRAVESLGGRITVYSKLGHGTRFDVRLPATGSQIDSASTQGESDEEDTDH